MEEGSRKLGGPKDSTQKNETLLPSISSKKGFSKSHHCGNEFTCLPTLQHYIHMHTPHTLAYTHIHTRHIKITVDIILLATRRFTS